MQCELYDGKHLTQPCQLHYSVPLSQLDRELVSQSRVSLHSFVLVTSCKSSWHFYEWRWRHRDKTRRWKKRKKDKWAGAAPLVVAGALVLVEVEAGDNNVPSVWVRNVSKRLSLVKFITVFARVWLVVLLSSDNAAAWNQAPSSLHINGPPESPWTQRQDRY